MENKYSINWIIENLNKSRCSSQIEDFIIDQIRSKQLNPGDSLPSYRTLAKINNVSQSSVKRAYSKLMSGNWLATSLGSGTFVSINNPIQDIPHRKSGFTDNFPAGLNIANKNMDADMLDIEQPYICVGTDFPSPSSFPIDKFSEYVNRLLDASKNLSQAELLNGYNGESLKDAMLQHLNRSRNFGLKHNMLDIIKGRKSCLDRLFKILISPGDIVINTSPFDVKLSSTLSKYAGVMLHISRRDEDFLKKIERAFTTNKIRAIHIRPQCSHPEGLTLNTDECERLIELARVYRVCIIEEDDDHEYWYGNSAYKPLACYEHDGYVIYTGALSKATPDTLALRVIVSSAQFMTELHALPLQSIETRDVIEERATAEMILNGDMAEYSRQIRLKSKIYRDELDMVLKNHLGDYVTYNIPEHGLTYWINFPEQYDLNLILKKLDSAGIAVPYHPNNIKTNKRVNHMVLGFGAFDINEAEGGAKMIAMVMSEMLLKGI